MYTKFLSIASSIDEIWRNYSSNVLLYARHVLDLVRAEEANGTVSVLKYESHATSRLQLCGTRTIYQYTVLGICSHCQAHNVLRREQDNLVIHFHSVHKHHQVFAIRIYMLLLIMTHKESQIFIDV